MIMSMSSRGDHRVLNGSDLFLRTALQRERR